MTKLILSVDPGMNNPAAALWQDGTLKIAERVSVAGKLTKLDVAERCRQVSKLISLWYLSEKLNVLRIASLNLLVVEWPVVYKAAHSKGDPNDLPPMAGINVGLAAYLNCEVKSYKPREWTGGCPKAEHGDAWASPRGIRVWERLSAAERDAVVPSHDAIDAVGLGLHHLGRFAPRRW